jgi:hypothetical protein
MRMAIYSDVHGNLHALDAVLADIARAEVDAVYCLGDLVGYGAFPNGTIERVRMSGTPTVIGNYDDGVGFDCRTSDSRDGTAGGVRSRHRERWSAARPDVLTSHCGARCRATHVIRQLCGLDARSCERAHVSDSALTVRQSARHIPVTGTD